MFGWILEMIGKPKRDAYDEGIKFAWGQIHESQDEEATVKLLESYVEAAGDFGMRSEFDRGIEDALRNYHKNIKN